MSNFLSRLNTLVWGAPALLLILGVGSFLTIRLGAPQLRLFPQAFRSFIQTFSLHRSKDTEVSPFRALCTALGATVGTGNLAGVAGAICLGGPGALFWMWVSGILGMVTKYAETVLAVHYRVRTEKGFSGGPMYVITRGLGSRFRPLAVCYCLFGIAASFGVGNAAQVNAVISGVNVAFHGFGLRFSKITAVITAVILAAVVGPILLGGAKRIGLSAESLVPIGAACYILMCIGALLRNADAVPDAICAIVTGAFSPKAVTGGILGSAFRTLRVGCSRGVFTNEAGMGTASIAHAAAEVSHPAEQGLMGIMEVFLDTIVICTLTGLVILTSPIAIPYGQDAGAMLTSEAFRAVYGEMAALLLAGALAVFASASILGWSLYGASCAEFLFGKNAWKSFALAQIAVILVSAILDTGIVWQFSELFNGLMAIPNLIALAILTPEAVRLTKEYKESGIYAAGGGNYANLNQRKSL